MILRILRIIGDWVSSIFLVIMLVLYWGEGVFWKVCLAVLSVLVIGGLVVSLVIAAPANPGEIKLSETSSCQTLFYTPLHHPGLQLFRAGCPR